MENDQKNLVRFEDREEAFIKLYDELVNHHLTNDNSIVLSTSFAGLFLADRLAAKLDSSLDMLFRRRLSLLPIVNARSQL